MTRFTPAEMTVLGILMVIVFFVVIAAVYAVGGFFFTVCWNFLVPSLWAAAPVLTWKQGVAASWLIGILQGIFGGGIKIPKEVTK